MSSTVLMTGDTVGGVWTYALELARALRPHGIEFALATMGEPLSRSQKDEVRTIGNIEVFESRYKLEWMEDPWSDVAASGDWLLELEQRLSPVLIHLNGYAHAALPWEAPKLIVAHSCVFSWWQAVHGYYPPDRFNTYFQAVQAGLQAADLVIAPTQAMLAALDHHYGLQVASRVIPNGRRLEGFRPQPKHNIILSAGRVWDAAKNISALTAAAPFLPWPVYVAGAQAQPGAASNDNASLSRHRPTSIGHQTPVSLGHLSPSKLTDWFSRTPIYALPARYEPFGLSALEAALSGCALVLGDIPSLRELWGDAALFVSPDSPAELTTSLLELISNPGMRQGLAAKAGATAARYTPELMASRYFRVYQMLKPSAFSLQPDLCVS